MRARVSPLLGLLVGVVAPALFGWSGCSAKPSGASNALDAAAPDTGAPLVTPAPAGAGGCELGLPLAPEGCIGADAGAETVTSDGKPVVFGFAAADPATGDWQASGGGAVAQVFYSSADNAWEANLLSAFDQANPTPIATLRGTPTSCTSMTFSGGGWSGTLDGTTLSLGDGTQTLALQRTPRPSPTLCAPPPAGAVLLFDGTNFDQWGTIAGKDWLHTSGPPMWTLVDGGAGGAMEVQPNTASIITQPTFGACTIHVEFRTLGTPTHSGVFPEARYQITILQTYGLLSGNLTGDLGNENPVVNPTVHAERPPLMWQTLDIDFTPSGGGDGGAGGPSATVRLNGVTLFEDYALSPPSGAAASLPPAPTGPILLEYHGMPLQYRNIWVVPSP
ncbi:MAG TPA: DUF1080 domain-containing protein [Polyangiaceae bacterium]|jgi:hypothetical protein